MANQFGVDRARFLAFAAAIAGAASFQAYSSSSDKQSVDGGAAGQSSAGRGPLAGAPSAGDNDSAGGSLGDLPGGAAGAISGCTDCGSSNAGAAGASDCSDSAAVPDCSELTAWCTPYCHAAVMNLKPAVAEAAAACLKLDTTGNCDTGYACLAAATAKGCPEDVSFLCSVAATACSHPRSGTEPSCVQLLSGLNDSGRSQAESCISQGCYSVYSCAEGLFFQ